MKSPLSKEVVYSISVGQWGEGEKGLISERQDFSFYTEKYGGLCGKEVVREVF